MNGLKIIETNIIESFKKVKKDLYALADYVANFAAAQKKYNFETDDRIKSLETENDSLKKQVFELNNEIRLNKDSYQKSVTELRIELDLFRAEIKSSGVVIKETITEQEISKASGKSDSKTVKVLDSASLSDIKKLLGSSEM